MENTFFNNIGTKLSSVETSIEAMEEAGLDWGVDVRTPKYSFNGEIKDSPEGQIVIRTDTGQAFGVVGGRYEPVQNQKAFQFFDPIVKNTHNLEYTRAGSLDYGRLVFLVATIDDPIDMGHGDIIHKHIFLLTSHDGSSAISMSLTPVRLWCKNLLNVSTSEQLKKSFNHTDKVSERLDKARVFLDDAYEYYNSLEQALRQLRSTKLNDQMMKKITRGIFEARSKSKSQGLSSHAVNDIERIMELFHTGEGITSDIENTCYAGFNALSEFADHHKTVRSKDRPEIEARFEASLYGSAKKFKQQGFNGLIEYAN